MKALCLLSLLLVTFSTLALSNENNVKLDSYISENKKELFDYDYKKNEADSSILRDSWIAPININYNYLKSKPYTQTQLSESAAIKMDQPIFQSGGIYYGIKFAQFSQKYSEYSIDIAKRKMIKDAISILMQIKQTSLKISKQKLQIENSEINLKLKQEQYLNGQLDSGFLDNAVIERNVVIQALYDIQTTQEKLISSFKTISDMDYENADIPFLELLNQEEFLEHNLALKMSKSQIQRDRYAKNVTVAKYLPKVSFVAGYNWSKNSNQLFSQNDGEKDYPEYGFRASVPLDINTFRDIESSRIDYLKSQVIDEDKEKELISLYEQVMQNINNFNKKILLSKENKEIYSKLLDDTRKLYTAGYKTEYDVQTLENSVNISKLDTKIYGIDKQLELLNLYEIYVNGI